MIQMWHPVVVSNYPMSKLSRKKHAEDIVLISKLFSRPAGQPVRLSNGSFPGTIDPIHTAMPYRAPSQVIAVN
jgi:hypothetical protein